jgi:hypothetical protein
MKIKRINNTEEIRKFIIDTLQTDVFENPKSRKRELVEARALFYKIALETNPELTLTALARLFNKHHASIIHSINLYNDLLYKDYDVYLSMFITQYDVVLTLSNGKTSLLKEITSKVLKIDDTKDLKEFEQEIKELLIKY